jgi:hypothetical protein
MADSSSVIAALESQLKQMSITLSSESRRFANARFLAESFEKQAIAAHLAWSVFNYFFLISAEGD